MANGYKIIWSGEAFYYLDQIVLYLQRKWSQKEVDAFLNTLGHSLQLISQNPLLFPTTTQRSDIRKCVLSKHTSIYYTIHRDQVFIVTLFDNRQDPKKLR